MAERASTQFPSPGTLTISAGNYTLSANLKRHSLAISRHSWLRPSFVCYCLALLTIWGCGSSNTPPPQVAEFTISLSSSAVSQQAGGATSQFSVSINGQNGFTGSVSVSLSGLPSGSTTSPPSPFVVAAGNSQAVTLTIPAQVAAGSFQVSVNGTSGVLSHSAPLGLTVTSAADFSLSISPALLMVNPVGSAAQLSISIAGLNGFTNAASISLVGLPAGTTTQPASPFMVAAGQNQGVTLSVPVSAAGIFGVGITATSGSLSHQGQIALTVISPVTPTIKTYDTGTMLYLETDTATETARIGLLEKWGDAITEVSLNGTNYVNSDDPGRQIQTSLWDGNADYLVSWGYNPIESGDHFFDGSPVLASTLQPDSIYTKTQPIQWAPENFGGGPGNPVLGDAYIEKWISVVPGYNRVFKVHYKITHFGTDTHAAWLQELPVMYVNPNVTNFIYYGGGAPWTNDTLSQYTMPSQCCVTLPTPEMWGAYVDATNTGIALYTPNSYPDSKGFNAGSTLQFTPARPYSWDPGSVLEFDTYILVGSVQESRAAIYALQSQPQGPSPLPAFGNVDLPNDGDTISGSESLEGWGWALSGMASVDVFVDGSRAGPASIGLPRPDIPNAFPGAPGDTGFQYSLDTTKLSNGSHSIVVKATDKIGHVSTFAGRQVTVSN
jgi:hypothetical protein